MSQPMADGVWAPMAKPSWAKKLWSKRGLPFR